MRKARQARVVSSVHIVVALSQSATTPTTSTVTPPPLHRRCQLATTKTTTERASATAPPSIPLRKLTSRRHPQTSYYQNSHTDAQQTHLTITMSDRPPTAPAIAALMNPPPAPLTWEDVEPLAAKCAALIKLEKDEAKAKAFATRYSNQRAEDGVLALFCDGSASQNIPEGVTQAYLGNQACKISPESRRWTSSSVAFKKNPTDAEWQLRGYPTPDLFSSTNAELDGFDRAIEAAKERLRVDFTITKLMIFTDSQNILEVLQDLPTKRRVPNWHDPLLLTVMQKMAELAETPGVEVEFRWQPGHCGVEGNEKADFAAGLARPDRLWPEAYPADTSNKNKSRRTGNMARESAQQGSVTAQKYQQQRKSNRVQKRARKRATRLSLQNIENLDPEVPIPSIEGPDIPIPSIEDPDIPIPSIEHLDIPIPSIEEDVHGSQKDNKGAREEQKEGENDSDSGDSILSDPPYDPLYSELDRGWRESGPERKTKEQEEEERKRKEDEESFKDPLFGSLLRALTEGKDKLLYGKM